MVASANVGDAFVLAEPVHGSAPDLVGKGIANPIATLRAAALLLRHLHYARHADALEAAVDASVRAGVTTPDLGGRASSDDVCAFVARDAADRMCAA